MNIKNQVNESISQPLLSIVIVNYNYGRFLKDAIYSVVNQTCQDFELIIVDGGSIDDSLEIIKEFEDKIAWWCSEKDSGQSDAFNKGFNHAKGRFLTWLNADDVFFPNAVANLKRAVDQYPECEWFVGGCFWLDPELKTIKCSSARPFSRLRAKYGGLPVWAPSSFFTRKLFKRAGDVDVNFHYMMDTELWMRFYQKANVTYQPIKGFCWGWRLHPDAKTSGHKFADSAHAKSSHPKWKERQRERDVFRERYGVQKSNFFVKYVMGINIQSFLKNKVDSWRFKGKHYTLCLGLRDV